MSGYLWILLRLFQIFCSLLTFLVYWLRLWWKCSLVIAVVTVNLVFGHDCLQYRLGNVGFSGQ